MRQQMTIAFLIVPLMLFVSCETPVLFEDSITLAQSIPASHFFSFSTPGNMHGYSGWGTDSFVGEYTSDNMTLLFDLGIYSEKPTDLVGMVNNQQTFFVQRRQAFVTFGYAPGVDSVRPYFAGVYFPVVSDTLRWVLGMYAFGKVGASQDTALAIFRSIKFTM